MQRMAPRQVQVIWDLDDDADGNYWHSVVEGHGVTREEVEEVLGDDENEVIISRSSGNPMTFGWTSTGKHIAVVFEEVDQDPYVVYRLTAFPAPPRRGQL